MLTPQILLVIALLTIHLVGPWDARTFFH